ncbi:4-hydroxy-tetrahydrodipicolinate synthase [Paraherbaspirillum soli]|uniref:4-hydroxy-tetrahydrodipicolinate synthase n=1 Tax=Paraherbaspirillum soli TaxID=631222 RepID=A0ABW0M899_9BURK
MLPFDGIWVPLVTPFHNGRIDFLSTQRLVENLLQAGIHGLVACGTTGEAATLSDDEQTALLAAVLEAADGRCPVLMGLGGSDTRAVAARAAGLRDAALAGFLISAPSYVKPSQQGIRLHFQTIAAATDRPIVLYNIPGRTGVNIEPATMRALAADPHFVAVKESGGSVSQLTALINQTPLKVLSGDDSLLLTTLCLGGHGAISAAAHIRPDLYVQMFDLVRAGQLAHARAIFNALLPLIELLFSEPNPGPVKTALAIQGKIHEELRLPMTPMSSAGKEKMARALEQLAAIPNATMAARQTRIDADGDHAFNGLSQTESGIH